MRVGRIFYFDSGHFIKDDRGSPCEEPHGHTYKLEVVVEGPVGKDSKVIDFREIKEAVNKRVMKKLDHKNLNEIFDNPTAENIARWISDELKKDLNIVSVKLWEGEGKWAEVEV